jgi:multidrug efflux pump
VAYDSSVYVEKAISEVWDTLAIAFGLVVLIIFVFLGMSGPRLFRRSPFRFPSLASVRNSLLLGYSVNILTCWRSC